MRYKREDSGRPGALQPLILSGRAPGQPWLGGERRLLGGGLLVRVSRQEVVPSQETVGVGCGVA